MNYSRAAIPLLASPQGVAASSIRYCEATEAAAAGVVFLLVFDRKTTPASRSAEASRYLLLARPPLLRLRAAALALRGGDARRGICSIPICSHLIERRYSSRRHRLIESLDVLSPMRKTE